MGITGDSVKVRRVTAEQSAVWLGKGWNDFRRHQGLGLAIGLVFALGGYGLVIGLDWIGLGSLILPLSSGLLLLGPLAAVALYEISRRDEQGLEVSASAVLRSLGGAAGQLGQMGAILLFIHLLWLLLAFLNFALFFSGSPPPLDSMVVDILFDRKSIPFLITGMVLGGVLAAITFAISVVSIPMLIDRNVSVAEAISASIRATLLNRVSMVGWAATIALVMFGGLAVAFIGIAVALPVLGHASWHAYRDLVAPV